MAVTTPARSTALPTGPLPGRWWGRLPTDSGACTSSSARRLCGGRRRRRAEDDRRRRELGCKDQPRAGPADFDSLRRPISCLATTEAGDRVVRTTDGGDHFAAVTPSTDKIFAAAFASTDRRSRRRLRRNVLSNDAGATWAQSAAGSPGPLRAFARPRARWRSRRERRGARANDRRGPHLDDHGVSTPEDLSDVSFVSATSVSRSTTAGPRFVPKTGARAGRSSTPAALRVHRRWLRRAPTSLSWSGRTESCARATRATSFARGKGRRSPRPSFSRSTAAAGRSSPTAPRT